MFISKVASFVLANIIFFSCWGSVSAEILKYKNVTKGGLTYESTLEITKHDQGYRIRETNELNQEIQIYDTDYQFDVKNWQLNNANEGTDFTATRVGEKILIKGHLKRKTIEIESDHDEGIPWYQIWPRGFKGFISSGAGETAFLAIEKESLRVGRLKAKVAESRDIVVNGREIASVPVYINLPGVYSLLWKGAEVWFRQSDLECVYSRYNPIARSDVDTSELVISLQ